MRKKHGIIVKFEILKVANYILVERSFNVASTIPPSSFYHRQIANDCVKKRTVFVSTAIELKPKTMPIICLTSCDAF